MFLHDNRHFSTLRQSFAEFEGEHLENGKDGGFEKYRVQFTEETHLEGDPIFECTDYVLPQDYDQCLEAEYVRQTLLLLNCTPPWLTDNQDLWCKDRLNISDQQADNINLYFDQILDGKFPNGNCLKPCKFMRYSLDQVCLFLPICVFTNFRYKVVYQGRIKTKDLNPGGIVIDFNNVLEMKVTSWQVSVETLTSRIGGVIGVGKELLWVAILLITSSVSFLSLFSIHFKKSFK